jgi:amidase
MIEMRREGLTFCSGIISYNKVSASILLGQAVEYDLGNVYDPAYTMVCKLRKSLLAGRAEDPSR